MKIESRCICSDNRRISDDLRLICGEVVRFEGRDACFLCVSMLK